jgi:hypothetical protein
MLALTALMGQDISRVMKLYQQAETLALVFMVDSTSSMGPHIAAVKSQITSIVQNMRLTNPQMKLHVGFIGYRDHSDKSRFEMLPLTTSIPMFEVHAPIRATNFSPFIFSFCVGLSLYCHCFGVRFGDPERE